MDNNLLALLTEFGFDPKPSGTNYRVKAVFRNSNDYNIVIYPDNIFQDFVEGIKGPVSSLLAKVVRLDKNQTIDIWLKEKKIEIPTVKIEIGPHLARKQTIDKKFLNQLIPDYSYYQSRGISEEILKQFQGGVCLSGTLKNRFVFPIFDEREELIGLCGRSILPEAKKRWIILGSKKDFIYPIHLAKKHIETEKAVIITEGISDIITLFQVGIYNCLCLFGVDISLSLINFFLRQSPLTIFICLNSDYAGQTASGKLKRRLLKYFDSDYVKIISPPGQAKDLNEFLTKENKQDRLLEEWKRNFRLIK